MILADKFTDIMGFRADYYEALTWKALKESFNANVIYEPARENHICGSLCEFQNCCSKYRVHQRLIHTVPDFLVELERPLFVHVCYWDSKETSHAKFWRTVSEIAELKCFVPNSQSLCVIFETNFVNNDYISDGWYSEFLRSIHHISDKAVFFSSPSLYDEMISAEQILNGRSGTQRIFDAIFDNNLECSSLKELKTHIINPPVAPINLESERTKLWKIEREFCSKIPPYGSVEHSGEHIRNALLQIVLLMGILNKSASDVLSTLQNICDQRKDFSDRNKIIEILSLLPISNRENQYQFLAHNVRKSVAKISFCELNEDLNWLLTSIKNGTLSIEINSLLKAINICYNKTVNSDQIVETFATIKNVLDGDAFSDINTIQNISPESWVELYQSIPQTSSYNMYIEFLLEGIGLGTYPLVREYNRLFPNSPISRNDLRSLYSNKRSIKNTLKQSQIVKNLAKMFRSVKNLNLTELKISYLFRKIGRLIGAQSSINPLEELVVSIIQGCKLKSGVIFRNRSLTLDTLASSIANSNQLGTWRVNLSFETKDELIPIFLSAMKSPGNCSDKTREFSGHLRYAKYILNNNQVKLTRVKRGIAILEGGYADDDKRAFHLSGFKVCSLSSLENKLNELGLIEN